MSNPKRIFTPHEQEMIRALGRSGAALDAAAGKLFGCGRTVVRKEWVRIATYEDLNERAAQVDRRLREFVPPPPVVETKTKAAPSLGSNVRFHDAPEAIEADRHGRLPLPQTVVLGGSSLW